jgi:hypothetical protein
MAGVGIGMQEADGDGLDAVDLEIVENLGQAGKIERLQLGALVGDAAMLFAAVIARQELLRLLLIVFEEVWPVAPGVLHLFYK